MDTLLIILSITFLLVTFTYLVKTVCNKDLWNNDEALFRDLIKISLKEKNKN